MKILPILILVAAGSLRAEEPPKPTQTPAGAKAQMHVIPPGKRVRKAQTAADPAWIANGKDKLPKLQRVCGTTDNVRAVFYDAKGVNAIVKMALIVEALDAEFRGLLAEAGGADEWLGPSTINLGMIHGGTRSNIVADACRLRVDIRTTPGLQRAGGALALLTDLVKRVDETASVTVASEAFHLDTDTANPFVRKLIAAGGDLTGAPWFCDAAFLAAAGTPAVAIGPGSIAQAHTKDEFIAVSDLEAGVSFFVKFLRSLK